MERLRELWRIRRAEYARVDAFVSGASLVDQLLEELDAALARISEETLSLNDAARLTGYSADHLGRKVRRGEIPNAGRLNAPRIRVADLPPNRASLRGPRIGTDCRAQIARSVVNSILESDND